MRWNRKIVYYYAKNKEDLVNKEGYIYVASRVKWNVKGESRGFVNYIQKLAYNKVLRRTKSQGSMMVSWISKEWKKRSPWFYPL